MRGAEGSGAYEHRPIWVWGAFMLLVAICLQILQQAQIFGQILRTSLDLAPTRLFHQESFELLYNVAVLALLMGALHDYEGRRSGVRRPAVFRFVLASAVLFHGLHVIDHVVAAGIGTGPFGADDHATLGHFSLNLAVLAALGACFTGLRARADLPNREELELARVHQEDSLRSEAYWSLARSERLIGELDQANELLEESMSASRACGDTFRTVRALGDLAEIAYERARYADALTRFTEILRIEDDLWHRYELRVALVNRAIVEDCIARVSGRVVIDPTLLRDAPLPVPG